MCRVFTAWINTDTFASCAGLDRDLDSDLGLVLDRARDQFVAAGNDVVADGGVPDLVALADAGALAYGRVNDYGPIADPGSFSELAINDLDVVASLRFCGDGRVARQHHAEPELRVCLDGDMRVGRDGC